jgi:hypothetical protein
MKRLEAIERKLAPAMQSIVLIDKWFSDTEEEQNAKLARWRAGENVEGLLRMSKTERTPMSSAFA